MLYIFHGSDISKSSDKARSLVNSLRLKKPDAAFIEINPNNWSPSVIEENLGGQGLFSSKYIILLNQLFEEEEIGEKLVEFLPALQESDNIFIVKNNPSTKLGTSKIFTAREDILGGVTRHKVIELARAAGFAVIEKEIKVKDLWAADEAFLTATNKNLMPVVQIDENKISAGKVGPVTKKLMALLQDYMAGY